EDTDAASAMGVDVVALKVLVFSLTSLLVGLTASVYYHTVPRLTPEILDLLEMGFLVVYAVVGGLESPVAGAVAAIILVVLLEVLRVITIGPFRFEPGVWRFAVFGALLVVTLRIAPDGFIGPVVTTLGRAGRRRALVPTASVTGGRAPAIVSSSRRRGSPPDRVIDLRIERVTMHFGGFVALGGVDLVVDRPQICGIIGP